jgi:AcrR family transcriptional regulator
MPSTLTPAPSTKGARTRARILEAAAQHEIARAIGVSHAAIYQHFGRKDELFRAAVEADLTALFETLAPTIEHQPLDPDLVVELVRTLVVAGRTHPLARRVIAEIDADQTEVLRDLPALADLEARLVPALAAAQRVGTVRDDLDPASLAAGVIGVALPMLVVAFRLDGMPDIPRAAGALDFLAAALRPPVRRPNRSSTS